MRNKFTFLMLQVGVFTYAAIAVILYRDSHYWLIALSLLVGLLFAFAAAGVWRKGND